MGSWDLWLDYHRHDADGLTHGNLRNTRAGLTLSPGQHIVVGNDEADAAVGEVVRIEENGVVLVRVLPGTVDDNGSCSPS
jgi:hypothetical protein